MDRYYYHGIGGEIDVDTLDNMITIFDTGIIKARDSVGYSGEEYGHVCLYKKNEAHNYAESGNVGTAYDGWINHAFCFIISPDVTARKTNFYHDIEDESNAVFTDLVDEWRSDGDIPLDRVVGIGMPIDKINELRATAGSAVDENFDDKLSDILMFAESVDWLVVNSDDVNFADRLDESLNAASNNKFL